MDKKQVERAKVWIFWTNIVLVALLLIGGVMGSSALAEDKSVPFGVWVVPLANAIIWSLLVIVGYYVVTLMIDHFSYMEKLKDKDK